MAFSVPNYKIKAGKKYICVDNYNIDLGHIPFKVGKVYKCISDNLLANNEERYWSIKGALDLEYCFEEYKDIVYPDE